MRGINMAGAVEEHHLDVVREAGFDLVRLPVEWASEHGFDRVDGALDAALRRGLAVVLDVHHFDDVSSDPDRHGPRLLALWERIAGRYADADPRLSFELLNEPHPPLEAERWNALLREALAVVRASNPTRTVIVGPVRWNIVEALPTLSLPDDEHLVATAHYYSPFQFTHQGVRWLEEAGPWLGTPWGTDAERARVRAELEGAAAWARKQGRALFLGEFGVNDKVGMDRRAAWTALVRTEAERLGMSWAYWDFSTDFGAFDAGASAWHEPLRRALLSGPAAPAP
jgi:endoglucanase